MDKTYCIFGDSVTQAAYIKNGWVDLFRQYLEEKYNDQFINVFNLGIGGNTSDDILKRFRTESEARIPTDIIFAFGVNDSGYFRTLDKPIVSEDRFIRNVESLIKEAKTFSENITFIGLTLGDDSLLKPFPESSQGKSYDLNRVKDYDKKLNEIARKNQCKFVSIIDTLKSEDFLDGLHPNDRGHREMFEIIKESF
jgi:lysophospholipase L1-like esterase